MALSVALSFARVASACIGFSDFLAQDFPQKRRFLNRDSASGLSFGVPAMMMYGLIVAPQRSHVLLAEKHLTDDQGGSVPPS